MNDEQTGTVENAKPGLEIGPFKIDISHIIGRIKDICVKPKETWVVIKDEQIEISDFFLNFLTPLVLFAGLCNYIGMVVFGVNIPLLGTSFKWPIVSGLVSTLVSAVTALVGIYIAGVILQKLASKFEGEATLENCLKLIGYSFAPVYAAGVLSLLPMISILGILVGLYCIYVFVCGVVPLTNVPESKKFPYIIVSIVGIFIAQFVLGIVASIFAPAMPIPEMNIDFSKFGVPPTP